MYNYTTNVLVAVSTSPMTFEVGLAETHSFNPIWHGLFWTVSHGGGGGHEGMRAAYHNFVVIAAMIMKFGTGIKLDVLYTMVKKVYDAIIITQVWRQNLYFSQPIGLNFSCS